MAHQIEMKGDKASMFYKGQVPWHGLGTEIKEAATAAQAIKLANLDFTVAKTPSTFSVDGKNHVKFPGKFTTYRTDTGAPLGVVGADYTPLQNSDAFKFFDPIIDRDEAIYETGGVLYDGRKVWLLAKMPEQIILKGDDVINQYLLLTTSHDGTSGATAGLTGIRTVCDNTLQAALRSMKTKITIRHTTNVVENLKAAHEILGLRNVCTEALKEAYDVLQNKKVNTKFITSFLDVLYPKNENTLVTTNGDKIRANILEAFEVGPGHDLKSSKGTAFGLYNGVTHVLDHIRTYANPNSKLQSLWFGNGARIENKAFNTLLDMCKN